MASVVAASRATKGRFWRDSSSAEGPPAWTAMPRLAGRARADCQATAVSVVSQGRQTWRLGIRRRLPACSIDWWVGPSSPRPMESWVKTCTTRCFISAAMRRALRE